MTPRELRSIKKRLKLEKGTLCIYPSEYNRKGQYHLLISLEDYSHLAKRVSANRRRKK